MLAQSEAVGSSNSVCICMYIITLKIKAKNLGRQLIWTYDDSKYLYKFPSSGTK